MNMAFVQSTAVNLFDQYRLLIPSKLKSHQDGPPGQRVLFITDKKESFTVSFEEGMQMRDMLSVSKESANAVSHQCCADGKYIHQRRSNSATERCAFFHIELEDNDGKTLYLSGQIVVTDKYQWSDGVEPVLMKLLEGIDVCKTKGGGSD
jgi:hypothetical protein